MGELALDIGSVGRNEKDDDSHKKNKILLLGGSEFGLFSHMALLPVL